MSPEPSGGNGAERRRAAGRAAGVGASTTWTELLEELRHHERVGLAPSSGRRIVEQLLDSEGFTELGRLVGGGIGQPVARHETRIPGEVVAGWGRRHGDLVFIVADEVTEIAPRNAAGASADRIVLEEARRVGAPYVSIVAAHRSRLDQLDGTSLGRIGLQVDFDLQVSSTTIPKLVALCGDVDSVSMVEAAAAHWVLGTDDCRAVLPDGRVLDCASLAELGWIDAMCNGDDEVVSWLGGALDLLRGEVARVPGQAPIASSAPPGAGKLNVTDIGEELVGDGVSLEFSGCAPGSLRALVARIGGTLTGVAIGSVTEEVDAVRASKLKRVCDSLRLPLVVIHVESDAPVATSFEPLSVHSDVVLVQGGPRGAAPFAAPYVAVLAVGAADTSADWSVEPHELAREVSTLLADLPRGAEPGRPRPASPGTIEAQFG